jgi:hypothetical protein
MGMNTCQPIGLRARKRILTSAMLLALFVGLTGCDSGGGSSAQVDADLQYSGVTTPAVINAANADQLAGEALQAGSTGSSLGTMDAAQAAGANPRPHLRSVNLPMNLISVIGASDPAAGPLVMDGALIQNIGTLTDTCGQGGYVDYDKSYDNETGDFSATYWFHEYCDKGSLISGLVRASGEVDLNFDPPELETYILRFRKLTDGSATLSGSLIIDVTGSPIQIAFNALIRDETTAKIYWVKDYTLLIEEVSDPVQDYITVDVSGTFYNPDHGFVRLYTDTILEIADTGTDEHPYSGAIIVEGKNSTAVKLTAIDNTLCRVEADTDGDGIYDVIVDEIPWSDL